MDFDNEYIYINFDKKVKEKMTIYNKIYNKIMNICKNEIDKDFFNDINNSFEYESEQPLSCEETEKIFQYLNSVDIPNIKTLFELLNTNENFERKSFVGIYPKYIGSDKLKWQHVGIQHNYLKYDKLQDLVNWFYKSYVLYNSNIETVSKECYKMIYGFILYLIYGKIHPHMDGNGRIGRLLFIENPSFNIYFPISTLLNKSLCEKNIERLYKEFNIPYKCFVNKENEYINFPSHHKYLNYYITEKITDNIMKCLIYSLVYKYLFKETNNHELCIKILTQNIGKNRIINYYNSDILDKFDYDLYKKILKKYNDILK